MELDFSNPEFLWLLLSLPMLVISHFFITKHLRRSAWRFANYEAIDRITGGKPSLTNAMTLSRNISALIIKCAILSLLIFSAAGASLIYYGKGPNTNFVLAVDASSSMLAQDFDPNRIEAAKKAAKLFVDTIAGGRIAVVSFSGTSFVERQLTRDKFAVKESIENIELKSIGGTDLGNAIITSTNILLKEYEEEGIKTRAIILLTDGRSTTGTDISEGVKYANKNFVTINTIGVGTEAGGRFANIDIVSTIDEESLIYIANSTNGRYFRAEGEEQLIAAYKTLAETAMEKLLLKLRLPLLLLALALIFIEWGLSSTKFRILP